MYLISSRVIARGTSPVVAWGIAEGASGVHPITAAGANLPV
jgi:hypothetical protein